MKELSIHLSQKGMIVSVPSLPGHDTTVEELEKVEYQEWIDLGQRALNELNGDGPRVIVALSMGCFIATALAADKSNRVDGLVLLAPAFTLQGLGRLGVWFSQLGFHRLRRFVEKSSGSDILDPAARRANKSYKQIPVLSLIQFERLRKFALQKIKEVSCPVFLGFGAQDHTVDNEKAAAELKRLSSSRVERHDYANSAHIVTVDYDHEALFSDVTRFIENL